MGEPRGAGAAAGPPHPGPHPAAEGRARIAARGAGDAPPGSAPGGALLARAAAPALVVAAVAAAYTSAFAGTFQFDDWNVIVDDPRVRSLAAWWRSMPGIRPLSKLTYALNHESGLGLAGFHLVNVALHAVNALLVLALVRRLEARAAAPVAARAAGAVAAVAALLFALHPAQTEAVTYVSGRPAALAAAFALGSALAWLAGRDAARPALAHAVSPLLLACALGAKEVAAVLPAALVALEATDPRRPFSWRAALRGTAVHWMVLVAAAAAFLASPVYRALVAASLALRDPWTNLVVHLRGLAWLAGQVVRPDLLDADPALAASGRLDASAALAGAAVIAGAALGVGLARRRPGAAAALLWTLLWAGPSGWLLPRPEPANDRQLYLALLGPAWLAARALVRLPGRGPLRAAAGALVVALAAGTFSRSRVYADEVRFWEAVLARSPANARAHNNLAVALAARCRLDEAEAELRAALALDPRHVRAAVNLRLLREGEPLGEGEPRCDARGAAPAGGGHASRGASR